MGKLTKIFIIQSLKTTDRLKSGEELNKKLSPSIQTDFKNIETHEELLAHLETIRVNIKGTPGLHVIHFDCHGNKNGIGIYDRGDKLDFISWEDLRDSLRNIYLTSNEKPIVSFSSCEGFNVARLVGHFKPCPYYLITGSFEKIGFKDSLDGYFTFYSNLDEGKDLDENVKDVKSKYPKLGFKAFTAAQLFRIGWAAYLNTQLTSEKIMQRKENIRAEFIALWGELSPEQEGLLENQFTEQGSDEHYQRYRSIFFS